MKQKDTRHLMVKNIPRWGFLLVYYPRDNIQFSVFLFLSCRSYSALRNACLLSTYSYSHAFLVSVGTSHIYHTMIITYSLWTDACFQNRILPLCLVFLFSFCSGYQIKVILAFCAVELLPIRELFAKRCFFLILLQSFSQ